MVATIRGFVNIKDACVLSRMRADAWQSAVATHKSVCLHEQAHPVTCNTKNEDMEKGFGYQRDLPLAGSSSTASSRPSLGVGSIRPCWKAPAESAA